MSQLDLLVYATRYALGRSSYAASDVSGAILAASAIDLRDDTGARKALIFDIREALNRSIPYEQEWAGALRFLEAIDGAS